MFDAFNNDAFANNFFKNAFDADAFRKATYEQGVKMLDLQRQMATAQLDQMVALTEASQKQLHTVADLQAKAVRDSMGMVLDAQKSAVEMWKPVEA
jgi:hypothetical protein